MTRIIYIEHDGTQHEVDAAPGINLMEAALSGGVPGIDGDCGGNAACATCHVHVADGWAAKLEPANDAEHAMLEFAEGVTESSRLACQIIASDALEGMMLQLPLAQH